MSKTIEDKYRKLTDVEHVLLRSNMYIGSTVPHEGEEFVLRGDKFVKEKLTYVPGFLKLFDEIISNSVDEHKRTPALNEIRVTINRDKSTISIWDNGGIPVVEHKTHKEWVPEMIFSNLKAGSNFDDSEERLTAGTNGVGSTLTNIFSKKFRIVTSDGKKKFDQTFTDNMHKRTKPTVTTEKGNNFTEITYEPDLDRLGLSEIDDDHYDMLKKRIYEIGACNATMKLKLTTIHNKKKIHERIKYRSFKDYVSQYVDNFFYEGDDKWQIGIAPSNGSFEQVSYVNTVHTKDGGTHVSHIYWQTIVKLRAMILKKHKIDVKPNELKNHMFIFVNCEVINSLFESQTKEKLITESKDFGSQYEVSEKTIKKIFNSEIIQQLLDWYEQKKAVDERRELRKLNQNLSNKKVAKLIDAKKRGNRDECILGIYEGLSALSAVRKFRDAQTIGAFPLRGKFINVHEMSNIKTSKNVEVQEIMASIGLQLGEAPKDLRFGKIYIYTDADVDGNSISGLLINFFYKFWPELFDQGRVYKVMTPIVVATKGKVDKNFYTQTEFDQWLEKTKDSHKWETSYKKGLASLEDDEYEEIITNPVALQLTHDVNAAKNLQAWFGGSSEPRKHKLLNPPVSTDLF